MSYIDGFLVAVPAANRDAYHAIAATAAAVFLEHGALEVVEAWGGDVPRGQHTDFFMAVQAEPEEVVVFSWVRWPSREARDAGNAKVMADPRMKMDPAANPFDGKRMMFGGFAALLEARA